MADVTNPTTPAARRIAPFRLRFPRLKIGTTLADMSVMLGKAFGMAYVEPYSSHRRRRVAADDDPGGRDPNW